MISETEQVELSNREEKGEVEKRKQTVVMAGPELIYEDK